MKIALISPKGINLGSNNIEFQRFLLESNELRSYKNHLSGIGSSLLLIAALTPKMHKVNIIDQNVEEIDFNKKYDLVGISALTQQINEAYKIADEFIRKNIKVVLGGIHSTVMPEEAKKHATSVVIGEAENVWKHILNDCQNNQLLDFYCSNEIVDLKKIPIPRYDLIKAKEYQVIWIQTSRGCPHDCEFCVASNIYGRKYRTKDVAQVINEIQEVKRIFGNITIAFADDNFFVNKKFSKKLLQEMIKLKIRWTAQSDISIADDDELIGLMRKSGCFCIFIGFESLTEEGLDSIDKTGWKKKQLNSYSESIQKIQNMGIGVHGAFILGLDNDNMESFSNLKNFIISNNLYEAQITILTPLPGTRLRKRLETENRILPTKWDNYTIFNVNFIHPILSKEHLEEGLLEIYKTINSKEVYFKKMQYFKQIQKNLIKLDIK